MSNIFKIIFDDNTEFLGGIDYSDTKWLSIPNKKIKTLFYRVPNQEYLCLSDYDKYFHMVEVTMDLNGERRGEKRLEFAYIMGKKNNLINVYKINLHTGFFELKEYDINDKFIRGLNLSSWR